MLLQLIKSLDTRLVQLRQETNMDQFQLKIGKKADKEYVDRTIQSVQSELLSVKTASGQCGVDVKGLTGIMNKVTQSVVMLEECNKDILVGKRKLDCLSCGETMS